MLVLIQFLVVFNSTSGTLALPEATSDLHLPAGLSVWIVSGYVLAFGGLLLLGGRLADIFGARRLLIVSVALFGAAASIAGLAPNGEVLVGARILQGLAAAGMAPSALALIAIIFDEPTARRRVMGVWGTVASAGSGLGVIGGGALTAWLGWRAALLVNVPFAIVLLIAIPLTTTAARRPTRAPASVLGAMLSVLGVAAVIAALTIGDGHGWLAPVVLLALGATLLIAFALVERRSANPFLPRRLLTRWPSVGGDVAMVIAGFTLYPIMVVASELLQTRLAFSALAAGSLILPISAATMLSAAFAPRLIGRLGTVRPVLIGVTIITVATAAFAITTATGTHLSAFLPVTISFGLGAGLTITSAITLALSGAQPAEAGAASGLAQTGQQLGGAIGLSVVTAFISTSQSESGISYGIGFGVVAAVALAGVAALAVGTRRR